LTTAFAKPSNNLRHQHAYRISVAFSEYADDQGNNQLELFLAIIRCAGLMRRLLKGMKQLVLLILVA